MSARNDDSDDDDDDVSTTDTSSDSSDDDDEDDPEKIKLKEPKIWPGINAAMALYIGGAMLLLGTGSMVCGVAGLARNAMRTGYDGLSVENYTFNFGAGIWAGAMLVVAGGLLVGSGIKKSTWVIFSCIVFTLLSGVTGIASFVIASLGLLEENDGPSENASVAICAVLVVLSTAQIATSVYAVFLCFQTLCGDDCHEPDTYENYRGSSSLGCGATMIICGLICLIANMAGIMWHAWSDLPYAYDSEGDFLQIGFGIWGSPFLIAGGAMAIRAKNDRTTWIIASTMTLCIMATMLSVAIIALSAVLVAVSESWVGGGLGLTMAAAGSVAVITSPVAASHGGILCGLRKNKVAPLPKPPEVPEPATNNTEGPVHAQMMYLDVQGLPAAISDSQAPPAMHIQPIPGVSTGQMLYLREQGGDGQVSSMTPYIIEQPMILGYQQAIIQQTLIPMRQINQDAMYSAEGAPPIVPIPGLGSLNTENDRGHVVPPTGRVQQPGQPSPPQLPTLNPPQPPRNR